MTNFANNSSSERTAKRKLAQSNLKSEDTPDPSKVDELTDKLRKLLNKDGVWSSEYNSVLLEIEESAKGSGMVEATGHPTQKNVKLMKKIITLYTKEGDTPEEVERPAVEKCIYCDQPLKQGLIRGMLHKCEAWKAEPPQDATIHDVVNGTPKGQEAVQKAIDDSIKVQNEIFKKAQDTSLDDILAILDDHHSIVTDELGKSCAKELLAWHKAEIAKLFEQIRSEAVRMNIPWGDGNGYDVVKAVDVEALTRLEAKQ